MPVINDILERHSWRFGDDDELVQDFHTSFMKFLERHEKTIDKICGKYGKEFHPLYFTNKKGNQNELSENRREPSESGSND